MRHFHFTIAGETNGWWFIIPTVGFKKYKQSEGYAFKYAASVTFLCYAVAVLIKRFSKD